MADAMEPFARYAEVLMDARNEVGLGGVDPEKPFLCCHSGDDAAVLQWKHFQTLLMECRRGLDSD